MNIRKKKDIINFIELMNKCCLGFLIIIILSLAYSFTLSNNYTTCDTSVIQQHFSSINTPYESINHEGLTGDYICIPQCNSQPIRNDFSSSVKNNKIKPSCLYFFNHIISNNIKFLTKAFIGKTGITFITPRACNYYVFALRHILC